jgi:3-oxoadipate enol-lactonase
MAGDGAALCVRVAGREGAPALLLLHSLGCDGEMWAPQIEALAGAFRIVAPDARGHGDSAVPQGDTTLDRLGRDVLDVMDALGIARANVCGLSMGGLTAQWLALAAPARVGRLVLANTASRIGGEQSWRERAAAVRAQGMAGVADAVLARFLGEAFRRAQPETAERFRQTLLRTAPAGYAACCAALRDADLSGRIGGIDHPTLVIGGHGDVSTPPEQARALQAGIPRATLLMLDSAHLSNVEQSAAFTAALRAHLSTEAG